MFLQETRLVVRRMENPKYGLGFECCMAVSCEGRSGGIALLWKKNLMVTILSLSKPHMHVCVKGEGGDNNGWFLRGIYGQPEATKRWNLIRSLQVPRDQARLIFGDFNEI